MHKRLAVLALVALATGHANRVAAQPPPAPQGSCVAKLDGRGFDSSNVVLPQGAYDVTYTNLTRTGQNNGKVADIYGGRYDTRTDAWYQQAASDPKNPCPFVIGGPTPKDVPNPIKDVDQKTGLTPAQQRQYAVSIAERARRLLQGATPLNDILTRLGRVFSGTYTEPMCEIPGNPPKPTPCDAFLDANSPFEGRDIIYIHGLMPHSLYSKVRGDVPGAQTTWPRDRAAFFGGGWWKQQADSNYWKPHIKDYLETRDAHNRFLIVAWPSTQTLEFGAHATLQQISDAMTSGTDVRTDLMRAGDLRGTRGFCVGGCVIVSHSTGGPVTDVALSLAAKTRTTARGRGGLNPLRTLLGNLTFIPNHVIVHVGLAPALSGSGIAGAAILASLFPGDRVICPIGLAAYSLLSGDPLPDPRAAGPGCAQIAPFALTSVLRDLTPVVMRTLWGPFIGTTPVPVLTVTGATPYDRGAPTKFLMLNGLDDGVVQMESTCARTNLDAVWPTGFFFDPIRSAVPNPLLYDLGMPAVRAGAYFADQVEAYRVSASTTPRAAAACSPFKAPWGMVEAIPPMPNPFSSPVALYPNHFSFIQSANNHSAFVTGGPANAEEVRAIQDEAVVARGLVSPSLVEEEEVKGWKVSFTLNFGLIVRTYEWWIWKRTYHRLQNWQSMHPSDYVYDFVLKP